ncbi:MAG: transposase [Pirellulaceae bacterium]
MIRDNTSEAAMVWADRLDRFDQAELTVAEFCRNEDVSQASYYYWRRKIRGTTKTDHPPLRESTSAQSRRTAGKLEGFLPVTLAAPPSSSPATVMAVDLPGGIRIRFEIPACNQEAGS